MAKKAEGKTQVNDASVEDFLNTVADEQRRADGFEILKLMQQVTKEKPKMWGASIVGFGSYHYKGSSGREGEWFLTGFSPRKQKLTVYISGGFDMYRDLLKDLGKHKTSMGCLYINRLADVDRKVLKELIAKSASKMKNSAK